MNIRKDMKEKKIINVLFQFMKFGIVGISNTIISLVIYYLLTYFEVHYIIANTVGFIGGTLNAFYWNNKYVFKSKGNKERPIITTGIKVFISYGASFLLSTILLFLLVDIMGVSDMIAPIINLAITIPLNFILNKLWAFKSK